MGKDSESGDTSCEDQITNKLEAVSPPSPLIKKEQTDPIVGTIKFHACTHEGCRLSFSRPWRLEAHLRLHKGERPYKCTEEGCTKDYSNNSHLRRHILTAHRSKLFRKKLKCPDPNCPMELADTNSLKRHIARKHGSEFVCPNCSEGFRRRQELKDHMYQHSATLPFTCSVCQAGFTRNRLLKRHMRCHKSYTCMELECGQKFDSWNALRGHVKNDHVAKEFGCNECGKSFLHKSRLRTHMWVHQNPLERPIFTCPYEECESFYFHSQNLSQHITSTHQGKLHRCPHIECNRELSTKQKLIDHMKLHDPNRKTQSVQRDLTSKIRNDTLKPKRKVGSKLLGLALLHEQEALMIQDHFMADNSLNYSNQVLDLSNKTTTSNIVAPDKTRVISSGKN